MRDLLRNAAILLKFCLVFSFMFNMTDLMPSARAQEVSRQELNLPARQENSPPQREQNAKVPMCANIQLAATYLRRSARAGGTAFLFAIHNGTDEAISVAMPAPTSAHWYALEGSRWSWRASNGAGGSPVDAMNLRGPVFAFRVNSGENDPPARKLIVPAHDFRNWEVKPADNPVVTFKPSCPHCNHPTDRQFRVVFAYAILPGDEDPDVLRCGLRTGPVAVPSTYARAATVELAHSWITPPVSRVANAVNPVNPVNSVHTINIEQAGASLNAAAPDAIADSSTATSASNQNEQ